MINRALTLKVRNESALDDFGVDLKSKQGLKIIFMSIEEKKNGKSVIIFVVNQDTAYKISG